MSEKKQTFILPERARSPEHFDMMEQIRQNGECPFCQKNFFQKTGQKILYENFFWKVVNNILPYENTRLHLMLVSAEHAESIMDLRPEAGQSLFEILHRIETDHHITSGAVFLRFGDPLYNGGSVNHLHFQLIVPDTGADKDWDKLKVKLGTNPK